MSLNRIMMIGHLTKNPEQVDLKDGNIICKFSVAMNETYKNKAGEKVENVTFMNVSAFGNQATNAMKYLTKGKQVFVEGKIQNRTWEDKEGVKKYATDVVANNVVYLSPKTNGTEANRVEVNEQYTADSIPF